MSNTAKSPLRDDLRATVLALIMDGTLAPGTRVKESRLAQELGVSRTPVREALLHLEREGFVTSELSLGFSVRPLQKSEVRELYPILWTLEQLALELSGASLKLVLPELKRINREFARHKQDPALSSKNDTAWHSTLISRCPNRRLLDMIGNLRKIIGRYEQVYMADTNLVAHSVIQHDEVISAIEEARLNDARTALEANWRYGMEALLLALEE